MAGFEYIIKKGDTLSGLAKKYNLSGWEKIYNHPKNSEFREKRPDPNKIYPGDIVYIPANNIYEISSGQENTLKENQYVLITDGHMHIQSNNCAPLPIQWAIVTKNLQFIFFLNRINWNRKKISDISAKFISSFFLGRLGKIGRLPTDLIAHLYMHKLENSQLRKEDAWIVDWNPKKNKDEYNSYEMGKKAGLDKLNKESINEYNSFEENIIRYYLNNNIIRFQFTQTYDLTFAHYWGRFGIPVYLIVNSNDSNKKNEDIKLYYINDFINISYYYIRNYIINIKINIDENVKNPQSGNIFSNSFHIYAKKIKNEIFSIKDQFKQKNQNSMKKEFYYNIPLLIDFEGENEELEKLINKDFIHLVKRLPQEEIKWIEDYKTEQLPLSEGSAINYPCNFFLFYHYDPRAHCKKGEKNEFIINASQKIINDHAFFTYKLQDSVFSNKFILIPEKELNNVKYWEKFLSDKIWSNDEVFNKIFYTNKNNNQKNALYWGIKIYPRLGYNPADFTNYPQLKELYEECSKNQIPILTHCSFGGMSIADYYNYLRYDSNIDDDNKYTINKSENYFVENNTTPQNWEEVLTKYKDLKLCLAHFGGYDNWDKCKRFNKFFSQEAVYSSNYLKLDSVFEIWINKICVLIEKYPNVYTDLSCFSMKDEIDKINITNNLIFLLDKYPKLKDRLILGTDWPMIEQSLKYEGIGNYMNNFLSILNTISEHFKFKYDALYQFSVINPLRFLGLLEEKDNEITIKTKCLENYIENIKKIVQDADEIFQKKYQTKQTINNIKESVGQKFIDYIKTINKIPNSEELLKSINEKIKNNLNKKN